MAKIPPVTQHPRLNTFPLATVTTGKRLKKAAAKQSTPWSSCVEPRIGQKAPVWGSSNGHLSGTLRAFGCLIT